ncbi:hypothetical protein D3C78_1866990 [compost metagenome]
MTPCIHKKGANRDGKIAAYSTSGTLSAFSGDGAAIRNAGSWNSTPKPICTYNDTHGPTGKPQRRSNTPYSA